MAPFSIILVGEFCVTIYTFMVTGINIKMSRESNPSSMNIQVRQTYLSTI